MDAQSEAFLETPAATVHRVSPAVTAEGRTVTASLLNTISAFEFVTIHDDGTPTRVAEDDDVTSIMAPSPPIIVAITPDDVAVTPPIIATTPPLIIVIIIVVIIVIVAIAPNVVAPIVVAPIYATIAPIVVVVVALLDTSGATSIVVAIAPLRRELGRDRQG